MKITLEKEYRTRYTLEQLEQARAFIRYMKEDSDKPEEMLLSVCHHIAGIDQPEKILSVEPMTTWRDYRVPYDAETGHFTAALAGWVLYWGKDENGRYHSRVAYVSTTLYDYWQICSDTVIKNAYIRVFNEQ